MLIRMNYKNKNNTIESIESIISNSPKQQYNGYYSKELFKELIKKMLFNELESFKSIMFQKSYILSYVWSNTYKIYIDDKYEIYRFENLTYDNFIFNFNSFKEFPLTKEQQQDYIINKIVSHIYCR